MSECKDDDVLELYLGDDWSIPFTLRKANGDPYVLTGATEMSFKFLKPDGSYLTKLLSTYVAGSGITVTSATAGKGLIEVPKAETATLKAQTLASHSMVVTIASKEKTARFERNISLLAR